ncbi:protein FAM207A-like [Lingula anatina]|uniref:Protein FAM207A-like n=1 Tax=Lingula anatina TaxID=7574 RepID=A0A1S3IBL2_LINAN|nr:protein FAM207A-like [Lingula anatina]|eukprot:XP_013394804.1 protein FAM207A-like [Lingula anatina]
MGKVKRLRQKFHNAAVKSKDTATGKVSTEERDQNEPFSPEFPSEGLFSGIQIPDGVLKQQLPDDFDTRSAITTKSLKGLQLKKKDKKKLRHEIWLQKVDAIQSAKKKMKEKKKRERNPIVGDMMQLEETLPTLELLLKGDQAPKAEENKRSSIACKKNKGIQKEKTRRRQMQEDMNLFKQVLRHPAYMEKPGETMLEHLQNRLKQEEDMDT